MNWLTAVCLLVGGGLPPLFWHRTDRADDHARFQGTWEVVRAFEDGEEATQEEIKGAQVDVANNTIRFGIPAAETSFGGNFTLDATKQPKHFDVSNGQGGTYPGIYRFEGNTLTIAMHMLLVRAKRPMGFESKKGSDVQVWVLKRKSK